jgi:hypothetical protein
MTVVLAAGADKAAEGGAAVRAPLTRRGDISHPLAVYLEVLDTAGNAADGTEVSVPASVTIPAGQASAEFAITPLADHHVDGDQTVSIRGRFDPADNDPFNVDAEGRSVGSPDATGTIAFTVKDADKPTLAFNIPVDQLLEGAATTATVTIDPASSFDATVELFVLGAGQLDLPATVTIPAGQTATSFAITAIQDAYMEAYQQVQILARALTYGSALKTVGVVDDDLYAFAVTLDTYEASEADAATRIRGTVTRTGPIDRKQWVELTSSDQTGAVVQPTVLIPAGATSARFNLAVVDDTVPDGTQTAIITATPIDNNNGQRITAAAASTTIRVLDDDSPFLTESINVPTISEATVGVAAIGTVVRHGPDTSTDLVVTLVSGDTTEATVQPTVTIPAGADSAHFNIYAVDDGVADGTQTATIHATAQGYTEGAAWLSVTDADFPDLVVRNVAVQATACTEQDVHVTYEVVNLGVSAASGVWIEKVYACLRPGLATGAGTPGGTQQTWAPTGGGGGSQGGSGGGNCGCGQATAAAIEVVQAATTCADIITGATGDAILLGGVTYEGSLPVGMSYGRDITVHLPNVPGDYYMVVVVDAAGAVAELDEGNNVTVSAAPVRVSAAYGVTVSADPSEAKSGDVILLYGVATMADTGLPAAFKPITVRVLHNGTRRVAGATTNERGEYSVPFPSLRGEAGYYEVAAGAAASAAVAAADTPPAASTSATNSPTPSPASCRRSSITATPTPTPTTPATSSPRTTAPAIRRRSRNAASSSARTSSSTRLARQSPRSSRPSCPRISSSRRSSRSSLSAAASSRVARTS